MSGQVLGRYELLLPIASGGMAMVWVARLKGTRGFQKIVAVKTMLPKLSEDEQFEKMFLDEASLASQIRHPHVVEILDLGEQNGVLFLVMEWIDGIPLNQLMKVARQNGGLPIPIAVRIAMQACAGLHAAHELRNEKGELVGLVHRDVSPQNILVTYDGVAKVVDFGVAKATAFGDGGTMAGQIKGKVAYMAPEQVKDQNIDRRVDIFALGIVLYALTTGKHPFRKETEMATMKQICAPQPVLPPRKVAEPYPAQLEAVVLKALAKDPARRFQTANDMLRALDQLPSQYRASTDSEVAQFLERIMGERRKERREQLAIAIERANQNPSARDWSLVERSMPSGISIVSGPGDFLNGPVPTVSIGAHLHAEPNPFRSNRTAWVLGGFAVLLAGAVGATAYIVGGQDDSRTKPPAIETTKAVENSSAKAGQEHPVTPTTGSPPSDGEKTGSGASATGRDGETRPVNPASTSRTSPSNPGSSVRRPPVGEPRVPRGSGQASGSAQTDGDKDWKTDPGF